MEYFTSDRDAGKGYSNSDSINVVNYEENNYDNYIDLYDYENNIDRKGFDKENKNVNFFEALCKTVKKINVIYVNLLKENKLFLIMNLVAIALYITIIFVVVTRL